MTSCVSSADLLSLSENAGLQLEVKPKGNSTTVTGSCRDINALHGVLETHVAAQVAMNKGQEYLQRGDERNVNANEGTAVPTMDNSRVRVNSTLEGSQNGFPGNISNGSGVSDSNELRHQQQRPEAEVFTVPPVDAVSVSTGRSHVIDDPTASGYIPAHAEPGVTTQITSMTSTHNPTTTPGTGNVPPTDPSLSSSSASAKQHDPPSYDEATGNAGLSVVIMRTSVYDALASEQGAVFRETSSAMISLMDNRKGVRITAKNQHQMDKLKVQVEAIENNFLCTLRQQQQQTQQQEDNDSLQQDSTQRRQQHGTLQLHAQGHQQQDSDSPQQQEEQQHDYLHQHSQHSQQQQQQQQQEEEEQRMREDQHQENFNPQLKQQHGLQQCRTPGRELPRKSDTVIRQVELNPASLTFLQSDKGRSYMASVSKKGIKLLLKNGDSAVGVLAPSHAHIDATMTALALIVESWEADQQQRHQHEEEQRQRQQRQQEREQQRQQQEKEQQLRQHEREQQRQQEREQQLRQQEREQQRQQEREQQLRQQEREQRYYHQNQQQPDQLQEKEQWQKEMCQQRHEEDQQQKLRQEQDQYRQRQHSKPLEKVEHSTSHSDGDQNATKPPREWPTTYHQSTSAGSSPDADVMDTGTTGPTYEDKLEEDSAFIFYIKETHSICEMAKARDCSWRLADDASSLIFSSKSKGKLQDFMVEVTSLVNDVKENEQDRFRIPKDMADEEVDKIVLRCKQALQVSEVKCYKDKRHIAVLGKSAHERSHGMKIIGKEVEKVEATAPSNTFPRTTLGPPVDATYGDTTSGPSGVGRHANTKPTVPTRPQGSRTIYETSLRHGSSQTPAPTHAHTYPNGIKVSIVQGNIAQQRASVIVCAANGMLKSTGGLAAVLAKVGGPSIELEARQKLKKLWRSVLEPGEVLTTGGGLLQCDHVIHAIGPDCRNPAPHGQDHTKNLYTAAMLSLQEADAGLRANSICIPAISSGNYGMPVEECARTIVTAIHNFCLSPGHHYLRDIRVVLWEHHMLPPFAAALRRMSSLSSSTPHEEFEEVSPFLPPLQQSRDSHAAVGHVNPKGNTRAANRAPQEKCAYCRTMISSSRSHVLRCNHRVCSGCNQSHFRTQKCVECRKEKSGGPQPENVSMQRRVASITFPGDWMRTIFIEIVYDIPAGKQRHGNPSPGKPYKADSRTAYLPNTHQGEKLFGLLKKALEAGLIFTIGYSESLKKDGVVIWNGIEHKSRLDGGK